MHEPSQVSGEATERLEMQAETVARRTLLGTASKDTASKESGKTQKDNAWGGQTVANGVGLHAALMQEDVGRDSEGDVFRQEGGTKCSGLAQMLVGFRSKP